MGTVHMVSPPPPPMWGEMFDPHLASEHDVVPHGGAAEVHVEVGVGGGGRHEAVALHGGARGLGAGRPRRARPVQPPRRARRLHQRAHAADTQHSIINCV